MLPRRFAWRRDGWGSTEPLCEPVALADEVFPAPLPLGDMALRIEKAFGVDMETLMRMQNSYDIAQTRKREGDIKVAPFRGKPDELHGEI